MRLTLHVYLQEGQRDSDPGGAGSGDGHRGLAAPRQQFRSVRTACNQSWRPAGFSGQHATNGVRDQPQLRRENARLKQGIDDGSLVSRLIFARTAWRLDVPKESSVPFTDAEGSPLLLPGSKQKRWQSSQARHMAACESLIGAAKMTLLPRG